MGLNRSSEFKTTHFVFRPIYDRCLIVLYVNMFKKKDWEINTGIFISSLGVNCIIDKFMEYLYSSKKKKKHGTTSEERQSFRKWMTAAVIFITDYCRQFFNWCYSPYTDESDSNSVRNHLTTVQSTSFFCYKPSDDWLLWMA